MMNGSPPIESFSAVEKKFTYVGYAVIVLVTAPPSNTTQLIPARSIVIAAASPHGPAPTMATSTVSSALSAITRPR